MEAVGSSTEELLEGTIGLTMSTSWVDLGGEALVEVALQAGLPSMQMEMRQTPPQLALYCYIEDDSLLVGVEEDNWGVLVESASLDPTMTENLYTYVEGDRLEAVVE
jgi:hypothetical protein